MIASNRGFIWNMIPATCFLVHSEPPWDRVLPTVVNHQPMMLLSPRTPNSSSPCAHVHSAPLVHAPWRTMKASVPYATQSRQNITSKRNKIMDSYGSYGLRR